MSYTDLCRVGREVAWEGLTKCGAPGQQHKRSPGHPQRQPLLGFGLVTLQRAIYYFGSNCSCEFQACNNDSTPMVIDLDPRKSLQPGRVVPSLPRRQPPRRRLAVDPQCP